MLSPSEKRFMQSWKEQREGPRWQYYLQYIIAWAVVIFLVLFFIIKLIMEDRSMGGINSFYIVLVASIFISCLTTHIVYTVNEKRYHKTLLKEKINIEKN